MEYKSDEWGRKIENQNAGITSIALQVSCRYTQLKEDDTVYSVAQRLSNSVEYMFNHRYQTTSLSPGGLRWLCVKRN